jgi:ABC-type amino acid transport substrate-binding protein
MTMRRVFVAGLALALFVGASSSFGQPTSGPSTSGTPLKVGTKVVRPFAYKDEDGRWTGISIELWREIARIRGYQFEWTEAANTDELIQWVATGKVDVGIAAITMKPSRAELVDFSNSMFESGVGIAVRATEPGPLALLSGVFSARFLGTVGGLAGLLLSVGFLVWVFERRSNPDFEQDPRKGLWSGFWWSAVTMTTVGYGDKAPKTVPGRLLGLVWMFASIIMISGFTAVVASSLTTQRLQFQVSGPDDLYDVRVGAKSGESPVEILNQRGISPILFATLREGLDSLARGEVSAFVHDRPVLQFEILADDELKESVFVLPALLREEEYGIAIRPTEGAIKNRLREDINNTLLEVKIAGTLREIETRYLGTL